MALVHAEGGRYHPVHEALERALTVNPRHLEALQLRAELAWVEERAADALKHCDEVLSLCPSHPETLLTRLSILLALDRPEESAAVQELLLQ